MTSLDENSDFANYVSKNNLLNYEVDYLTASEKNYRAFRLLSEEEANKQIDDFVKSPVTVIAEDRLLNDDICKIVKPTAFTKNNVDPVKNKISSFGNNIASACTDLKDEITNYDYDVFVGRRSMYQKPSAKVLTLDILCGIEYPKDVNPNYWWVYYDDVAFKTLFAISKSEYVILPEDRREISEENFKGIDNRLKGLIDTFNEANAKKIVKCSNTAKKLAN